MLRAPVSNRGLTISFRCKTHILTKHTNIMKTLSNKKQTIFTKIRTPFGSQIIKSTIVDEWKFQIGGLLIDSTYMVDNHDKDFQVITYIKTSAIQQIEIVCGVPGITVYLTINEITQDFELVFDADGCVRLVKTL